MTSTAPAVPDGAVPGRDPVQDGLDRIARQLDAVLAAQAEERAERERRGELWHELLPVAQAAMGLASDELEDLSREITVNDAKRFARTAVRSLPQLEAAVLQLVSLGELMHEVNRIAGAGMASLSGVLSAAEDRGTFAAARHGAAVGGRLARAFERDWPDDAPSTLALLRSLRDPRTRLGLARLITLLRALGEPEPPHPHQDPHLEKD